MANRPPGITVVLDATVVIHLARAASLALLGCLDGYDFVVTEQVVEEVTYPEQALMLRAALLAGHLRVVRSTDMDEMTLYAELRARMGKGEAASLALAARRNWVVASDDRGRAFSRLVGQWIGSARLIDTMALARLAQDRGLITQDQLERIQDLVKD